MVIFFAVPRSSALPIFATHQFQPRRRLWSKWVEPPSWSARSLLTHAIEIHLPPIPLEHTFDRARREACVFVWLYWLADFKCQTQCTKSLMYEFQIDEKIELHKLIAYSSVYDFAFIHVLLVLKHGCLYHIVRLCALSRSRWEAISSWTTSRLDPAVIRSFPMSQACCFVSSSNTICASVRSSPPSCILRQRAWVLFWRSRHKRQTPLFSFLVCLLCHFETLEEISVSEVEGLHISIEFILLLICQIWKQTREPTIV